MSNSASAHFELSINSGAVQTLDVTFDMADRKPCNQHPWMKAYIGVLDHPFFAVSDRNGQFKIEGLPPGTYQVVAWQEILGEKTAEITVGTGPSAPLKFNYDAKDYRQLYPPFPRGSYSPR